MSLTTRGLGALLRLADQPDLPVTVLLRHDAGDAALVRAVVLLDADDAVELRLDRRLLTAGLSAPASDGDVRVSVVGTQVAVAVGDLTVLLGLGDLVDVLLETYTAAPTGSERDAVIKLTAALELLQA